MEERNFYIPDLSRPIVLEPHQKALLRLIEARDSDGQHRYRTFVYSTPKKSGKTTIAALVARFRAETGGRYQEIYCVANDLEQAQGRVFQAARASIELSPGWRRHWKTSERELCHLPNGSVIRAIRLQGRGRRQSVAHGLDRALGLRKRTFPPVGWQNSIRIWRG